VIAVLLDSPLKQTAAGRKRTTRFAFWKIESFPIRNGFPCIAPQGRPENAKLMVVDGHRHIPDGEIRYSLFKFVLIIVGVNPQRLNVPGSIAGILQTHQRNVLNERQIAVDILNKFG
jgi:hypothetical protein